MVLLPSYQGEGNELAWCVRQEQGKLRSLPTPRAASNQLAYWQRQANRKYPGGPMIVGKWFITPHAVRRYIERVDHRATYDQALAELVRFSKVARPSKEIKPGIWLYRGGKPLRPRFMFSVSPRRADGSPGLPQLITVKAGHDCGFRRVDERGRFTT
jgi:hypothetical protein